MEALAPALDAALFGIGHIAIGCALSYLDFRFAPLGWRTGRPRLTTWHAAMEARPSMRAADPAPLPPLVVDVHANSAEQH